jgi:hypothetical protein
MEPLNYQPIHPVYSPEDIRDTALRRRLQVELSRIADRLAEAHLDDEMTQQIRLWRDRFFSSLRSNADVVAIQEEFTGLLQELLVDPISQAPLDEEAVLGSDGRTYGAMSLTLYIHSAPEAFKGRSPLDPQDPTPFSSYSHPIVRHMTSWLKDHQALLHSEELERTYRELMDQRRTAAAAVQQNNRMDRIRRIREQQGQRDAERDVARNQRPLDRQLQQAAAEVAQNIRDQFFPVHQRMQDHAEHHFANLADLERRDQRQMIRLRGRVEQLDHEALELEHQNQELHDRVERVNRVVERRLRVQRLMERGVQRDQDLLLERGAFAQELLNRQNENAHDIEQRLVPLQIQMQAGMENNLARLEALQLNDQERADVIQRRIDQLGAEAAALERENRQLRVQINRVDIAITETERADAQLQIAINETRQAINDRKSGWASGLLTALATIGACAFATWALQGVFLAAGSSVQGVITPIPSGAKFGLTIAF